MFWTQDESLPLYYSPEFPLIGRVMVELSGDSWLMTVAETTIEIASNNDEPAVVLTEAKARLMHILTTALAMMN